ncbi:MAG: hypothetical protein GY761_16085 [Hyphomicrobiales bacterium]|nr:hypothetical protein [Hyphomicrobiales bacterium]
MEYFNDALIELIEGNPEQDFWLHGELKALPDYQFFAKVYDCKSNHGLKGSRISKLEVFRIGDHWNRWPEKHQCHTVAHYDRGWDLKPSLFKFKDRQAVRIILRAFKNEI